jgi:hypothetical protein
MDFVRTADAPKNLYIILLVGKENLETCKQKRFLMVLKGEG